MNEYVKQFSLTLTLVLNTIVLITAVLKISSVIYGLKQSIADVKNLIEKEIVNVTRLIDSVSHSVQIIEIQLNSVEDRIDSHNAANEKSRELLNKNMHAELKELETELKLVRSHVRDLENFTQKNNPEFHVRP